MVAADLAGPHAGQIGVGDGVLGGDAEKARGDRGRRLLVGAAAGEQRARRLPPRRARPSSTRGPRGGEPRAPRRRSRARAARSPARRGRPSPRRPSAVIVSGSSCSPTIPPAPSLGRATSVARADARLVDAGQAEHVLLGRGGGGRGGGSAGRRARRRVRQAASSDLHFVPASHRRPERVVVSGIQRQGSDLRPAIVLAVAAAVVALALSDGGFTPEALGAASAGIWVAVACRCSGSRRPEFGPAGTSPAALAALGALAALTALSLQLGIRRRRRLHRPGPRARLPRRPHRRRALVRPGAGPSWLAGAALGGVAVAIASVTTRLLGLGSAEAELAASLPRSRAGSAYPLGYWNALGYMAAAALPGAGLARRGRRPAEGPGRRRRVRRPSPPRGRGDPGSSRSAS